MTGAPRPKLKHRLEYAGFRAALAATNLLPERVAGEIGARLGQLGRWPLGIRAAEVERNLQRAFPASSPEWRAEIAAASYAHLGREMVAMMRLSHMPHEELLARTEIIDIDRIGPYYRNSGRGAVVVGGHFGNWEVGAAMIAARGYTVSMVAQRQTNPLFDRHLVAARERLGIKVIERGQATKLGLRALRNQEVVVFGADQNAGRSGLFVPFFGVPASTHRGPALMAVRTNSLVFVATPIRVAGERWQMGLEEVVVDREGEVEDVVLRLTRAFTERLEAAIRREPGQYLWQHRRWKTRPPEEPEASRPV